MKNAWSDMNEKTRKDVFFFSEEYMDFLDAAKTEREACAYFTSLAESEGFALMNNSEIFFPVASCFFAAV